ncbi:MAG: D-aminoacylase [Acidobacteriota bacterium]|nr:D-aminoacylase [Acidobacteriota bacterium]
MARGVGSNARARRAVARSALAGLLLAAACAPPQVDLVLRGGSIADGGGGELYVGDVAIDGDAIVAVGDVGRQRGRRELAVDGLVVAPGFVNMLSWATVSLLEDPRAQSDVRQGVTLEVFGEGWSMGPLNEAMKQETLERQSDIKFDVEWTTLGEYLSHLETRGVAPNVASFVGATTVRIHELGYEDRAPTAAELEAMRGLVRAAMEEGALGVGSSLIYAPASFADTDELVALVEEAAAHGGLYVSHIRNEGEGLLAALDELIEIARRTGAKAEVYHFKASRPENWHLLEPAIAKIESARAAGLEIAANMYTYPASATGLDAAMPTWVQEGGHDAWVERLRDPEIRERVRAEMDLLAPEKMLFIEFRNDALADLTGKTLAEVAALRGTSPEDTVMDLVVEDDSRVGTIYFSMSEDSVRRKAALPWMSFGSDAGAPSAEGVFLASSTHPRAYGTFARVLGRYARDEKLFTLGEAVRRLTSWPASRLGIADRGRLRPGYFADLAVFDAARVRDLATFEQPHRYSEGMVHVFVNGVQVLADGEPTGATPGRFVRGPGYRDRS